MPSKDGAKNCLTPATKGHCCKGWVKAWKWHPYRRPMPSYLLPWIGHTIWKTPQPCLGPKNGLTTPIQSIQLINRHNLVFAFQRLKKYQNIIASPILEFAELLPRVWTSISSAMKKAGKVFKGCMLGSFPSPRQAAADDTPAPSLPTKKAWSYIMRTTKKQRTIKQDLSNEASDNPKQPVWALTLTHVKATIKEIWIER